MTRRTLPIATAASQAPTPDRAAPISPHVRLADSIEPLLSQEDLARVLNASRRTIERMRAAGKLPRPDLRINKMPRWKQSTIREWIDEQSRKGVAE
jgi:predicted DNA-binding transcriptional regulator AlpA